MYNKNFKSLKEEIEEDTQSWKHLPCSWTGRISKSKMAFHQKQSTDSMQPLSKFPAQIFTDLDRTMPNFIWKIKIPRIAETIKYCTTIKLYYRAIVIKTLWYWHKNRQIDQWN